MTAVRSVDGFRYGARLSAYFLLTVGVGSGGVALGAAVGYEHALAAIDGGGYDAAELIGGGLLAFSGAFLALAGLFGLLHKLLADGIAAGTGTLPEEFGPIEVDGIESSGSRAEDGDGSPKPTRDEPIGPSPGEQAAREYGATQLVSPRPSADADSEQRSTTATASPNGSNEGDEAIPDGVAPTADSPEQRDGQASSDRDEEQSGDRKSGDRDSEETPDEPERSRPKPSPEEIAFGTAVDESEEADAEPTDDTDTSAGDPLVDPTGEE